MHEELDNKRWQSTMVAQYTRQLDFNNFNISSLLPELVLSCMDCLLDYSRAMAFLSTWLDEVNFEVWLQPVHTNPADAFS